MIINGVLIRKLKAPVFNTRLWIVVSTSIVKSLEVVEDHIDHRIIKEEDKKSTAAYTYGYTEHDGRVKIIIFVKHDAKPGVIAHEANHAVNMILQWHGVKPSFSNDENESYYLGWIVDKIHNTIKMFKK